MVFLNYLLDYNQILKVRLNRLFDCAMYILRKAVCQYNFAFLIDSYRTSIERSLKIL
jgi:hypothetical protein